MLGNKDDGRGMGTGIEAVVNTIYDALRQGHAICPEVPHRYVKTFNFCTSRRQYY